MKKLLLLGLGAGLASLSFADFNAVNSSAALGGNDFIDWAQFGPNGTVVASGAAGLTNNGIGFHVFSDDDFGNDDGGELLVLQGGPIGNFPSGESVLFHANSFTNDFVVHSVLRIRFDTSVMGVGAQLQSNLVGNFTATAGYWNPFPDSNIGFSANSGVSSFGQNPGDAYTGGLSTESNINDWFSVASMDDGSDNLGFGMGRVDVKTSVPEPASMVALGIGALALIRRRRK